MGLHTGSFYVLLRVYILRQNVPTAKAGQQASALIRHLNTWSAQLKVMCASTTAKCELSFRVQFHVFTMKRNRTKVFAEFP